MNNLPKEITCCIPLKLSQRVFQPIEPSKMQTMGKHFVRLIEKLEKPKSLKTLTNIESRFIIVKKGHLKAGKAHPLLLTLKSSFKNRAMNFMSR